MTEHASHESGCHDPKTSKNPKWWQTPLFWVISVTTVMVCLSWRFSFLAPFRNAFFLYFKMLWLPVTAGLVIGGCMDYAIPNEYISKHLSLRKKRTILYSAGLGFLMSGCSHGILAISIQLYKKGASVPAVVSFLLASPWANLTMVIVMFGLFGWQCLLIISGAFLIAIITGWIFLILDHYHWIEHNPHTVAVASDFGIMQDVKQRLKAHRWTVSQLMTDLKGVWRGTLSLSQMVLIWIVVGMVLASATSAYVPTHFFSQYVGPNLPGLAVTMAIATVIEICSEGTSPVAFEIYRQTGALGNAFVFLMGGVVTDYTELALLWSNIGKKTAFWVVIVAVPQVIGLAWLMNYLR